jgi:hypothetical protein
MEAGGFEPPSRDVSRQASTCLVALLAFALPSAKRQALGSAISVNLTTTGPNKPAEPACYLTPFSGPQAKPERTGYIIRQPFATDSCQLIVCRMISQANRRPGHATCLSAIRSKPFAPVLTFQYSHPCRYLNPFSCIYYTNFCAEPQ